MSDLQNLVFRRERSRPIFRNKHTGVETTVMDLAVNDHGGFQGGCRQFVVVTDEEAPPGPPSPPSPGGPRGHNVRSLDTFLRDWEFTGSHVTFEGELPETEGARWKRRALDAERKLGRFSDAARVLAELTA